jgi:hypothetical protein
MDVIIGPAARRGERASAATVAPSHAEARFTAALWGRPPATMAAADRSANTVYTSVGGKP